MVMMVMMVVVVVVMMVVMMDNHYHCYYNIDVDYLILQGVKEGAVLHPVPEVGDLRLAAVVRALLDDRGHGGVHHQRDLRDVDVLLEVQQPHLQLGDLLLHAGGHLVAVPVRLAALTDEGLEVGRHGGGHVAVQGLVGQALAQGDHPEGRQGDSDRGR